MPQKSRSRNERENRNKKDRYPADKILSGGDFANASAILPIHSDLQPICRGGNHEIWSAEGWLARHKEDMPLPSLGRKRL